MTYQAVALRVSLLCNLVAGVGWVVGVLAGAFSPLMLLLGVMLLVGAVVQVVLVLREHREGDR